MGYLILVNPHWHQLELKELYTEIQVQGRYGSYMEWVSDIYTISWSTIATIEYIYQQHEQRG